MKNWIGPSTRIPDRTRRNVRVYAITGECLLTFLRGVTNHWMRLIFDTQEHDFPLDADITGVFWDFQRQAFLIRVHHPSFDAILDGEEAPFAGLLSVMIAPNPTTESMSRELDDRDAIIHDLREQLAGRGS